jgi:hypothetical protein
MQHEWHIAEEMALDEAALDQVIGQRGVFLTLDDIRQHAITLNIRRNTLSQFITQRDRVRQEIVGKRRILLGCITWNIPCKRSPAWCKAQ